MTVVAFNEKNFCCKARSSSTKYAKQRRLFSMRPNIFRHLTSTLCLSSRSFHGGNVCRNVMKNFYGWESVAKEGDAPKLLRLPNEKKNEWEPSLSRAIRSFKITFFSFSPPTRRRKEMLCIRIMMNEIIHHERHFEKCCWINQNSRTSMGNFIEKEGRRKRKEMERNVILNVTD